jgi:hypothetical protein
VTRYDALTPDQKKLYNAADEAAVWSNMPVTDTFRRHLVEADAPAADKAAVMDVFVPGAGAEFLP